MSVLAVKQIQEVVTLEHCSCGGTYTEFRKELQWHNSECTFTILNVPYNRCSNNCTEEIMAGGIALHIAVVMDEMEKGNVPPKIDFRIAEKLI
jgi:hypothetical protein